MVYHYSISCGDNTHTIARDPADTEGKSMHIQPSLSHHSCWSARLSAPGPQAMKKEAEAAN